jgi:Rieske Fe-S protein
MDENNEQSEMGRRSFLAISVISLAGLISLGIVVPSIAYIVGPALQSSQEEEWVRLGSKSKVEIGVPTLFKVKIPRQTGWIQNEEEISVYVVTDDGRNYIALSNVCTHLGCRVRWITAKDEFFCPCHNGVFDKVGAVVSGPPPKPLDRYELKIESDQIFIKVG